jgi:hypothetical protein
MWVVTQWDETTKLSCPCGIDLCFNHSIWTNPLSLMTSQFGRFAALEAS